MPADKPELSEKERAAIEQEAAFMKNLYRLHDIPVIGGNLVLSQSASKDKLFSIIDCLRQAVLQLLIGENLPEFKKAVEAKKVRKPRRSAR